MFDSLFLLANKPNVRLKPSKAYFGKLFAESFFENTFFKKNYFIQNSPIVQEMGKIFKAHGMTNDPSTQLPIQRYDPRILLSLTNLSSKLLGFHYPLQII